MRCTWPGPGSIFVPRYESDYFNVPEELVGPVCQDSIGEWRPVFDETRSRSNFCPAAVVADFCSPLVLAQLCTSCKHHPKP